MEHKLLTPSETPKDFIYPGQLKRVVEIGATEFQPWKILVDQELIDINQGLKTRYPNRNLVPIAARQDIDDIACFDIDNSNNICIIHDYASPGWEQSNKEIFSNFHDWLRMAFEDFLAWGDYEADEY